MSDAEGIKTPWRQTTLLVLAITLLAAIITPAVKPSALSRALRLTSLKKKTAPAARAVPPT